MGKRDKRSGPTTREEPHTGKIPRSKDPSFSEGLPLAWRFSHADKGGPWAWIRLEHAPTHKRIIEKLHDFECQNMEQLKQTGSHPIPIENLSRAAQKRLEELQRDDLDELFSLRVMGRERIFCIQDRNIMKILWWDPEHQVCPSSKKHT